jgi:hypothetical protein
MAKSDRKEEAKVSELSEEKFKKAERKRETKEKDNLKKTMESIEQQKEILAKEKKALIEEIWSSSKKNAMDQVKSKAQKYKNTRTPEIFAEARAKAGKKSIALDNPYLTAQMKAMNEKMLFSNEAKVRDSLSALAEDDQAVFEKGFLSKEDWANILKADPASQKLIEDLKRVNLLLGMLNKDPETASPFTLLTDFYDKKEEVEANSRAAQEKIEAQARSLKEAEDREKKERQDAIDKIEEEKQKAVEAKRNERKMDRAKVDAKITAHLENEIKTVFEQIAEERKLGPKSIAAIKTLQETHDINKEINLRELIEASPSFTGATKADRAMWMTFPRLLVNILSSPFRDNEEQKSVTLFVDALQEAMGEKLLPVKIGPDDLTTKNYLMIGRAIDAEIKRQAAKYKFNENDEPKESDSRVQRIAKERIAYLKKTQATLAFESIADIALSNKRTSQLLDDIINNMKSTRQYLGPGPSMFDKWATVDAKENMIALKQKFEENINPQPKKQIETKARVTKGGRPS